MTRRSRFLVATLMALAAGMDAARAQDLDFVQTGALALDVPSDPRSVAMGESFVAVSGNPSALMYNPAGLARLNGAAIGYTQRQLGWATSAYGMRYQSAQAAVQTGVQGLALALMYQRLDYGNVTVSTTEQPNGIAVGEEHENLYVLGAGIPLGDHWDVGLTAKVFDRVFTRTAGDNVGIDATPAVMFDAGLMYSLSGEIRKLHSTHVFTAGMSFQNVGMNLKTERSGLPSASEQQGTSREERLPRYLRTGVSYRLRQLTDPEETLVPFQMLVTGELRYLLNPGYFQKGGDFWGAGLEATMFEILSVRLGLFTATGGIPESRYGLGVNIPLERLGVSAPLVLQTEYAAIPINFGSGMGYFPVPGLRSTLHIFSLGLRYTEGL